VCPPPLGAAVVRAQVALIRPDICAHFILKISASQRVGHHAFQRGAVLGSVQGSSLRFDRARARGLRALTLPPRSSSIGNCVMAGAPHHASSAIVLIAHPDWIRSRCC